MWGLTNLTPYAVERAFTRDVDGTELWLVLVKGTFIVRPDGSTAVAEEQEPVCLAPRYRNEPGRSSLLYETDVIPRKLATDVLLHGHAYAPGRRPVPQVDVSLRLGDLHKRLRVFGRRVWLRRAHQLVLSEPEPFDMTPLTYERAFGGSDRRSPRADDQAWERRNPVGTGFAIDGEHLVDTPVCTVEDPTQLITAPRDRPRPAGFGPIAPHWSPRVECAGTYDAAWEEVRRPLLPLDFDGRFYQCAPEDQRVSPFLRGGEEVELENLTPGGSLRFRIPRITLGFQTEIGGGVQVHRPNMHTVIVEPDIPRIMIVWHTALPCHRTLYSLVTTSVFEKQMI